MTKKKKEKALNLEEMSSILGGGESTTSTKLISTDTPLKDLDLYIPSTNNLTTLNLLKKDINRSKKPKILKKVKAGDVCPHCHYGILEECMSFADKTCEFFVYCPNCNAYICTYEPMPHQAAFHMDEHKYKLYAGGFGSAKTYTCGMEFIAYMLQIPNSAGLIGAATWGQAEETCLKFVTENIPKALVARSHQDKVSWYMDLVNGARISAKALDKEGKIRSANLNIIWVEEASEVDYGVVSFIQARLRNKTANFKGKTRLKMLLSSNPDVGWLNDNWLMESDIVYYHGNVKERYNIPPEKRDPNKVTHISATSANTYLPPHYEESLAKNKPKWWVDRYLHGSFKYTEGLVYPNFMNWFVEPFIIPKHWKRITGTDFGRRDPTAHVVAALDPVNKVIYIYHEVEETLDDMSFEELIKRIKQADDFPDYLLAYPNQCDPRGKNRDQVSGQTWISAYAERGIFLQPAQDCNNNSIAPTIQKVANYADNKRLRIFTSCRKIRESLAKYKYNPKALDDTKNPGEKPIDKYNHLPDAIRYMLSPFPAFPNDPDAFDDIWRNVMNSFNNNKGISDYFDTSFDTPYVTSFLDNFG